MSEEKARLSPRLLPARSCPPPPPPPVQIGRASLSPIQTGRTSAESHSAGEGGAVSGRRRSRGSQRRSSSETPSNARASVRPLARARRGCTRDAAAREARAPSAGARARGALGCVQLAAARSHAGADGMRPGSEYEAGPCVERVEAKVDKLTHLVRVSETRFRNATDPRISGARESKTCNARHAHAARDS